MAITATPSIFTSPPSTIPLTGSPFFGMQIEHVWQEPDKITVETSGAIYELTQAGLDMTRKIDPASNSVNPRQVACLKFNSKPGVLEISSADREICVVRSPEVEFRFHSDSLVFLTYVGKASFSYTHINIIDAQWDKHKEHSNRMWTDGYGGSLHALAQGTVSATPQVFTFGKYPRNGTLFDVPYRSQMAHMVFPAKPFDFEALYGSDARPFSVFTYNLGHLRLLAERVESDPDFVQDNYFGYAVGMNGFTVEDPRRHWLINNPTLFGYKHLWTRATFPPGDGQKEAVATEFYNIMSRLYPGQQPPLTYDQYINHYGLFISLTTVEKLQLAGYVQTLRQHGLKYLLGLGAYLFWLPDSHQDLVIGWLKQLREQVDYDGFYFDSGAYGAANDGPWYATYRFFRRLRKELGEDLYIFHHDSTDAWGGRNPPNTDTMPGLRAIMVDTYSNASLAGENGDIATIDDPAADYLRYYTGGYGLSQTHAHHKRDTCMTGAISEQEKNRALAENLNGIERIGYTYLANSDNFVAQELWQPFLALYLERRNAYLTDLGGFQQDVSWPPDWYRPITDADVTIGAEGTSAVVRWSTGDDDTDYSVSWIPKNGTNDLYSSCPGNNWWGKREYDSDGNVVRRDIYHLKEEIASAVGDPPQTSHVVTLSDLEPDTVYQLRIRSHKQIAGDDAIIWGYVGEFITESSLSGT